MEVGQTVLHLFIFSFRMQLCHLCLSHGTFIKHEKFYSYYKIYLLHFLSIKVCVIYLHLLEEY
jgi:hypothetical protein